MTDERDHLPIIYLDDPEPERETLASVADWFDDEPESGLDESEPDELALHAPELDETEPDAELDDEPARDEPLRVVVDASTSSADDSASDADDDKADDKADDAADGDVSAGESRHGARRIHLEQPARIAVASLALIAILFLFVFPTRSYLSQQRQVRSTRHSVEVLRAQNAELTREARELQTPAEIERMARGEFNMVFPGEQSYEVISPGKQAPG